MLVDRNGIRLHVEVSGPDDGAAVVFAHSLGTNSHLWDAILPLLPAQLRLVRYDLRGHGQSDIPEGPYTMGQLVGDAETICDALSLSDCLFVGLSVGGMVAQGLAVKRPDLIRALVLSNTAAKMGTAKMWHDRIAAIEAHGLSSMADTIMRRWFGRNFFGTPAMAKWLNMLMATPEEGYVGTCAAIAGTDFYTPTSGLRQPTLGIAGGQDGATPPDLVRETVDLIPGSQFSLMWRAGHLPCAEDPEGFAKLLTQFIADTGHLKTLAN
jgi:3-oxoadipate enol-lactonase